MRCDVGGARDRRRRSRRAATGTAGEHRATGARNCVGDDQRLGQPTATPDAHGGSGGARAYATAGRSGGHAVSHPSRPVSRRAQRARRRRRRTRCVIAAFVDARRSRPSVIDVDGAPPTNRPPGSSTRTRLPERRQRRPVASVRCRPAAGRDAASIAREHVGRRHRSAPSRAAPSGAQPTLSPMPDDDANPVRDDRWARMPASLRPSRSRSFGHLSVARRRRRRRRTRVEPRRAPTRWVSSCRHARARRGTASDTRRFAPAGASHGGRADPARRSGGRRPARCDRGAPASSGGEQIGVGAAGLVDVSDVPAAGHSVGGQMSP